MQVTLSVTILITLLCCVSLSLPLISQRNTPTRTVTKDQWREDLKHFAAARRLSSQFKVPRSNHPV